MNTNERHLLNDLFITAEQRVELLLISVVHDRDSFLSNTTSPTDKNSEISIRRSEIAGQWKLIACRIESICFSSINRG